MATAAYGLPVGEHRGSCAFRLMPTDAFADASSAAWVDSWHQPQVGLLTGTGDTSGAEVAYEYAPDWSWEVVVRRDGAGASMVMRNVVPEGQGGPAGAYDVMRATWS